MPEFSIDRDGLVHEESVRRSARTAGEVWPSLDPLALEANMLLVRAHRSIISLSESPNFGLTPSRASVVALLYRSPERRLTTTEMAAAQHVTPTNISKLIDGLERDGWVRRVTNPDDGRSTYAQLTEEGVRRSEAMLPAAYSRVTELWAGLTAEEKQLMVHLLAKLRMHILARPAGLSRLHQPAEGGVVPLAE